MRLLKNIKIIFISFLFCHDLKAAGTQQDKVVHAFSNSAWLSRQESDPKKFFYRSANGDKVPLPGDLGLMPLKWVNPLAAPKPQGLGALLGAKEPPASTKPVLFSVLDPENPDRVTDLLFVRPDGYVMNMNLGIQEGESLDLSSLNAKWVDAHDPKASYKGFLSVQVKARTPEGVITLERTLTSDLTLAFDQFLKWGQSVSLNLDERTAKLGGISEVLHSTGAPPVGDYRVAVDSAASGSASSGGGAVAGGNDESVFAERFKHPGDYLRSEPMVPPSEEAIQNVLRRLAAPAGTSSSLFISDEMGVDGPDLMNAVLKRIHERDNVPEVLHKRPFARLTSQGLVTGGSHVGGPADRIGSLLNIAAKSEGMIVEVGDLRSFHSAIGKGQSSIHEILSDAVAKGQITLVYTGAPSEWAKEVQSTKLATLFQTEKIPPLTPEALNKRLLGRAQNRGFRMSEEQMGHISGVSERYNHIGSEASKAKDFLDYVLENSERLANKPVAALEVEDLKSLAYKKYNIPEWEWSDLAKASQKIKYEEALDEMVGQNSAKEFMKSLYGPFNSPTKGKRSMVSRFLAGPPSLGKTQMAENAARGLGRSFHVINMGNYGPDSEATLDMFKSEVAFQLKKDPRTIFLFDEIEKARSTILKGMFDQLSKPEMTALLDTGGGNKVSTTISVRDSIGLFTSNAGQKFVWDAFEHSEIPEDPVRDKKFMSRFKKAVVADIEIKHGDLAEAFMSRMKTVVPFIPYNKEDYAQILVRQMQSELRERAGALALSNLEVHKVHLNLKEIEEVADVLADRYWVPGGEIREGVGAAQDVIGDAVDAMVASNTTPIKPGAVCDVGAQFAADVLGISVEQLRARRSLPKP